LFEIKTRFAIGFGFSDQFSSALMAIDQRPGKVTDSSATGAARNCYFPMPFAKSARLTLTNETKQHSQHWVEINYRTYRQAPENQLYFHAQYCQGTPPPEGPYLILDAKGRGHLVGCVLSVKNNDGGWWGEGDEIVEIDGKRAILPDMPIPVHGDDGCAAHKEVHRLLTTLRMGAAHNAGQDQGGEWREYSYSLHSLSLPKFARGAAAEFGQRLQIRCIKWLGKQIAHANDFHFSLEI
jgi:hypothetical protein